MRRVDIESALNESRNRLLAHYDALSADDLHRPLTTSEHDPSNSWHALDHFGHLALIEHNFVAMVRRHLAGDANPVGFVSTHADGARRREEILARVHAMTDEYQRAHHDDSLSRVLALTGDARAQTLHLLGELTDDQLDETLPGAPWADGTLGGVLGANSDHARMHWTWVRDALAESSK